MAISLDPLSIPQEVVYPLDFPVLRSCGGFLRDYSLWVWGVMLVPFAFFRQRRLLIGELLVMVAILRIIMRWPRLGAAPLSAYWDEPSLPWATAVIMISVVCLIWAYYATQEQSRVRCSVCGYNLAGSTGHVCVECGSPIASEIVERLKRRESLIRDASPSVKCA